MVAHANSSPKMVNPRDIVGNVEEEEKESFTSSVDHLSG